MADFKTHMGVSTATGALLAFAGYQAKMSWDTCLVAGTLCSVSGMLPDLDSNSGRPLREATALGAAVVPMMMVDRLQRLNLQPDTMVLIAIAAYISIRFVLAEVFRRYTVHRGMWHSIPAAATCGMFAFLVMSHEDIGVRLFKTSGVVLGFLSHLILDEIWSVDFKHGSYKFKSSFGTALKLWGNSRSDNLISYGLALLLGIGVWQDQGFMSRYNQLNPNVPHTVTDLIASVRQRFSKAASVVEDLKNSLPGGNATDGATESNEAITGGVLPGTNQSPNFQANLSDFGVPTSIPVNSMPSTNGLQSQQNTALPPALPQPNGWR